MGVGIGYLLLPLLGGAVGRNHRQAVAQWLQIAHQRVFLDALRAQVEAWHVEIHIGSKHRAVVGKYLSTLRFHHASAIERLRLSLPLSRMDNRGREQPHCHRYGNKDNSHHDEYVATHYVVTVLALCHFDVIL